MSDSEQRPGVPGLDRLYQTRTPDLAAEERVVVDLRQRGMLRAPARPRWVRSSLAAAAGVLLFAAGWAGGAAWAGGGTASAGTGGAGPSVAGGTPRGALASTAPAATGGPTFMLLVWEHASMVPGESPAAVARAYGAWAEGIAARGIPVVGQELGAERAFVSATGSDPPPPDALVGGYFIVEAETGAEAAALLVDHPHLARGGWIEIAPLVER